MANLDPASNPGSKPQRFSVKTCKSSTSDKLQTFKPIFGISCKVLAKNSIQMITWYEVQQLQLTLGGTFSQRNHATVQENKTKNQ